MKKKKRRYVRLFSVPEKAEKAKKMLEAGKSYGAVAKAVGCARTSVIYFHQKIKRLSLENFNGVKVQLITGTPVIEEKRNPGKNYKDYLKSYTKERKKNQKKRMTQAKKTIKKVQKYRTDNNILDYEIWDF